MTHRDTQDHWRALRLPVHGRRARVIVAMIGLLLSLGIPVAVLGVPELTVEGQAVDTPNDPTGLSITGALPGDSLPGHPPPNDGATAVPADGVPGHPAGAAPPGIPTPPKLPNGPLGIPGALLDAYQFAERTLAATHPGCHLSWSVLAGIGRIESDHASDGRVDAFGNTLGPILGPQLDGSPGMAAIPDTDRGVLDGDPVWDRAVGPMQFIPSSWRSYGVDSNGDGVANSNNIYDSTTATGIYLCGGGADLANPAQLKAAVFRYNHSAIYVAIVLQWAQAYLRGVVTTPSAPGPVPPGTNGNGGRPIVTDGASLAAAAPAAVTQLTPLAAMPLAATSSPPPPASPTTTASPATTPSPPTTPPTTAPSPPPTTTTTPSETTTPRPTTTMPPPSTTALPPTTTPPVTTKPPPPPPPPTTTPPVTTKPPPPSLTADPQPGSPVPAGP